MQNSGTGEILEYYRSHSVVTEPREYAHLYDRLPASIEDISRELHNVLIHNWKVYAEGIRLSAERRADIEIRPMARLLGCIERASAQPWDMERPPDSRVVVDCRHFATLLCSVLRHRTVPARTRHGFAWYLEPGHSQSHVICEYWDATAGRWVPVDPDTLQQDMPADRFVTADAAWRGIRAGALDAAQFGYGSDLRGAWCVRWEVIRDFAALNKHEMLTFDVWGLNASYEFNDTLLPRDAALLDRITSLLEDDRRNFSALRAIYEADERVRVPTVIRSQPYTTGLTHEVDLALDGSLPV
ncbi:transglutaminase-like domain-containing protein [Inquilinus ginsengisoli]|jgi:hypothetical protein|uniref:transglutaminase-like domain-containing protein n=1 Tax=Inquilinus ginsengisoli TaxID=363840 RepID=UPI003D225EB5